MFPLLLNLIAQLRSQQQLQGDRPEDITQPPLTPAEALTVRIAEEHLRQARYSFNLSLVIVAVSAAFSFAGAGLLLSGKTTEATVAAAGSLVSSVCHLQLAKEANDRLLKSALALKQEE